MAETSTDILDAVERAIEEPAQPGGAPLSDGSDRKAPDLEQEGDVAADYLEGLLDILDLDGDLDLDVEGDRAIVAVVGTESLEKLVGRRGETLEALQELTRLAVVTATGARSRLMLDIAGWRAARRTELAELGISTATRVKSVGVAEKLSPMTAFERKVVHDAAGTVDGVRTESEGDEPQRRVVILPA